MWRSNHQWRRRKGGRRSVWHGAYRRKRDETNEKEGRSGEGIGENNQHDWRSVADS